MTPTRFPNASAAAWRTWAKATTTCPDLAALALLAAWLPQHFHRQFRALFGISVQA